MCGTARYENEAGVGSERRQSTQPDQRRVPPRAVLDKFAAVQMLDVHFPTTDGRTLILSRYTELTADPPRRWARPDEEVPADFPLPG
jgi:hypothetical protein